MAKTNYENVKAWRKQNPDKVNAQARRRRERHPDKFAVVQKRFRERHIDRIRLVDAEKARQRRRNDPEGERARRAKFEAKKEAEKARIAGRPRPSICDVCRQNIIRIVFDHCHAKGHFRGWLCDRCNRVLGLIKDDPKLLRSLAKYLERSNGSSHKQGAESSTFFGLCWPGQELSGK